MQFFDREKSAKIFITLLIFVLFAWSRWSGQPPVGNDSDEHLLVAQTYISNGHFSVADLHATKYPPLTSGLLIALSNSELSSPLTMILLNYALIFICAIVLHMIMEERHTITTSSLVIGFFLSSATLWSSASIITGEISFNLLSLFILYLCLQIHKWTIVETIAVASMISLTVFARSAGIIIILPAIYSMYLDIGWKSKYQFFARAFIVVALPLALLALFMLSQAKYGHHPTGYAETFFLQDPYDASKGTLTSLGLIKRSFLSLKGALVDLAVAVAHPPASGLWGLVASAILLACVFLTERRRESIVTGLFIFSYGILLIAWPYRDPRFALPLLPIAAIGLGNILLKAKDKKFPWLYGILVALVVSRIIFGTSALHDDATREAAHRSKSIQDFDELIAWSAQHIPSVDAVASFDHRETTLRLKRPVLPLQYTSSMTHHENFMNKNNIKWLIASHRMYPLRWSYSQEIVSFLGFRAKPIFKNSSFEVFQIVSAASS